MKFLPAEIDGNEHEKGKDGAREVGAGLGFHQISAEGRRAALRLPFRKQHGRAFRLRLRQSQKNDVYVEKKKESLAVTNKCAARTVSWHPLNASKTARTASGLKVEAGSAWLKAGKVKYLPNNKPPCADS